MQRLKVWICDWLSGRARIAELAEMLAKARALADAADARAIACERMAARVKQVSIARVNDQRGDISRLQARASASANDLHVLVRAVSDADAADYDAASRRRLRKELERLEPSSHPRMSRARVGVVHGHR